jgi:phosphoribosylformylglycinamidine synthase PurS subunit
MIWRVFIRILPRAGLLDPQGQAVEHALTALRFSEATNVHVGKAISLDVAAESEEDALRLARDMCEALLANPVTEDYQIELAPAVPT